MSIDKQINLLDELQSLLEKQIEMTRQGSIIDIERLGSQISGLVEKITQAVPITEPEAFRYFGIELAEFQERRRYLQKLYGKMHLALTAQKADITKKLSQVRKGKKTIGIYRCNI